jgi:hypothetical protein
MRIFEDDAGYLAWIDGHQHGFVVNTTRKPDPRRDGKTARRRDGETARTNAQSVRHARRQAGPGVIRRMDQARGHVTQAGVL